MLKQADIRLSRLLPGIIFLVVHVTASAQADTAMLNMANGKLEVQFDPTPTAALRKSILDRITLSAKAVATYYGRYPVDSVEIWVNFHEGRGINSGHAYGSPAPHITISVGRSSTEQDFSEDWVTTHEMVHLAFPSVPEQHHWIEEGLATYIEPIARAQIGELTPEKVWGDMVEGMPNGMPRAGDRGLDFTHTWGRTYWGGALFCLLADIEIRKRTETKRGLEDGMRGILKAGGSIASEWTLAQALETADHAAGVSVLQELYSKMRSSPMAPNLETLWDDLGVKIRDGRVEFNNSAPLAQIRKTITQRIDR